VSYSRIGPMGKSGTVTATAMIREHPEDNYDQSHHQL
jgi:hypothetical protein